MCITDLPGGRVSCPLLPGRKMCRGGGGGGSFSPSTWQENVLGGGGSFSPSTWQENVGGRVSFSLLPGRKVGGGD